MKYMYISLMVLQIASPALLNLLEVLDRNCC